jgi:adenylate kinase family enzyme
MHPIVHICMKNDTHSCITTTSHKREPLTLSKRPPRRTPRATLRRHTNSTRPPWSVSCSPSNVCLSLFLSVSKRRTGFPSQLFQPRTRTDEKNEKTKETIRKKFTEYLERAEKLKDYLAKKAKKKPVAMMGDGGVWSPYTNTRKLTRPHGYF